jgi:hypothetical protein
MRSAHPHAVIRGAPALEPAGVHRDVPHLGVPDLGVPDLGVPDLGVPDLGVPDLGVPDLGVPGLGVPDLGVRASYARYAGIPGFDLNALATIIPSMPENVDTARAHDEEVRARHAIRKSLIAMEAEEREMERAMTAFEEDADQAKRYIEAEWRREHWGHEPERHPTWDAE